MIHATHAILPTYIVCLLLGSKLKVVAVEQHFANGSNSGLVVRLLDCHQLVSAHAHKHFSLIVKHIDIDLSGGVLDACCQDVSVVRCGVGLLTLLATPAIGFQSDLLLTFGTTSIGKVLSLGISKSGSHFKVVRLVAHTQLFILGLLQGNLAALGDTLAADAHHARVTVELRACALVCVPLLQTSGLWDIRVDLADSRRTQGQGATTKVIDADTFASNHRRATGIKLLGLVTPESDTNCLEGVISECQFSLLELVKVVLVAMSSSSYNLLLTGLPVDFVIISETPMSSVTTPRTSIASFSAPC